jgi:hypothetical protein
LKAKELEFAAAGSCAVANCSTDFNSNGTCVDYVPGYECICKEGYSWNAINNVCEVACVRVLAGTGTAGYSGDSRPATQAELNFPVGVSVDSQGNVYIAGTAGVKLK